MGPLVPVNVENKLLKKNVSWLIWDEGRYIQS